MSQVNPSHAGDSSVFLSESGKDVVLSSSRERVKRLLHSQKLGAPGRRTPASRQGLAYLMGVVLTLLDENLNLLL